MSAQLSSSRVRALVFVLSFCSFSYQLLIANAAAQFSGGRVFWHSITVGFYLLGLGIGTWRASVTHRDQARDVLFDKELRLAAIGGAAMLLVYLLHAGYRVWFHFGLMRDFAEVQPTLEQFLSARDGPFALFSAAMMVVTLVIGYLTGFEVPLLLALGPDGSDGAGAVLGINYLGAMLSTLVLALVLLPRFELIELGAVLGLVNIAALWGLVPQRRRVMRGAAAVMLVVIALGAGSTQDLHARIFYYFRYYSLPLDATLSEQVRKIGERKPVRRFRSAYQRLDVAELPWHGTPPVTTLFLDGRFQFDSWHERFYHETMAHVPPSLTGALPRRVLILGAGDGLLARELLKHGARTEVITLVELDPKMLEVARTLPEIRELNEGALDDPRIKVITGDGFHYIRTTSEEFDAIFVDFPFPHNYDTGKLYSREFYVALKRRIAPGGYAVIDAPVFSEDQGGDALPIRYREVNSVMFSTLAAAGFKSVRAIGANVYSFVVAMPEAKAWGKPSVPEGINLYALKGADLGAIDEQVFPHDIADEHVNSIFRPRLLDLPDTHY